MFFVQKRVGKQNLAGDDLAKHQKTGRRPETPPIAQELAAYLFPRGDSGDAAAGGQNLPMPLHRMIFALGFFCFKIMRIRMHDALIKNPFPSHPYLPPAPSSKPLDTPLLPSRPFSQQPSEGARGVYIVAHHVRGQGKDGGGGAARRSPSHRRRR
jgi:hypothetical protein